MASLYILIPIALVFVFIAIKAFMWAVDNHQYDDLDAAARSILFDDDAEVKVAENLQPQAKAGNPQEDQQQPSEKPEGAARGSSNE